MSISAHNEGMNLTARTVTRLAGFPSHGGPVRERARRAPVRSAGYARRYAARGRLLVRKVFMGLLVASALNGAALAFKCPTVPVRVYGQVVDGPRATPISGLSVFAFLDGVNHPSCPETTHQAKTAETGSFDTVACWTLKIKGLPFIPGGRSCGGRPKSVTLVFLGPDNFVWLETSDISNGQLHETVDGFEIHLQPVLIFAGFREW
jgi:hypothetical protein